MYKLTIPAQSSLMNDNSMMNNLWKINDKALVKYLEESCRLIFKSISLPNTLKNYVLWSEIYHQNSIDSTGVPYLSK